MNELDAAWAAGFFDGEGSVSIRWGKMGIRRTFTLYLHVVQVEREPLDKFAQIFGVGNVRWAKSQSTQRAPYHSWCTSGKSAKLVLLRMLPYLTVKRERTLLGLEFQARVEMSRKGRSKTGYRISDEEMQLRHELFIRMKLLNLRRVARAAAETKPESLQFEGCDSPVCNDDKVAEHDRNDRALKLVG